MAVKAGIIDKGYELLRWPDRKAMSGFEDVQAKERRVRVVSVVRTSLKS